MCKQKDCRCLERKRAGNFVAAVDLGLWTDDFTGISVGRPAGCDRKSRCCGFWLLLEYSTTVVRPTASGN